MNKKKKRINPYLVLLMKRMLMYEFVLDEELSNLQIANYLYNRHKVEKYRDTNYSDETSIRDHYAALIATRIKRDFLTPKDFNFSNDLLSHVVEETTSIRKFESWEEFEKYFSTRSGAIIAKRNFSDRDFSQLDQDEKHQIRAAVNKDIIGMHFFQVRTQHKNPKSIIEIGDDYCIRNAYTKEIREIEKLANLIYPCPINRFDIKKTWHDKNPFIFYIYKDDYGLWANINLLPIDSYLYEDLKSGKRYENKIFPSDLYTVEEKAVVNYIYVEGFACTIKKILLAFANKFSNMLANIADLENEKLTICAIGGSREGDLTMKTLGFKRAGTAIEKMDGISKEYPFMEIKWLDLRNNIGKIIAVADHYDSDERHHEN